MYNIWCFFNRFLIERESHQQKNFPMEKRFRTPVYRSAADETMLLISSTEPNTANAVDDVIVSDLIVLLILTRRLFLYCVRLTTQKIANKEQNNEVKILKNKYHPQHWLYLVLLMK